MQKGGNKAGIVEKPSMKPKTKQADDSSRPTQPSLEAILGLEGSDSFIDTAHVCRDPLNFHQTLDRDLRGR